MQQSPFPVCVNLSDLKVGCAGWNLPRATWSEFSATGTQLQRYATRFNAVEVNSSFYRPHHGATYAHWASNVPNSFRFAVKLPKAITHDQRLQNCSALLDAFLAQVSGLGNRLGCLLVQLPPSLAFDAHTAGDFLRALRKRHAGPVALEPRHASWFTTPADELLQACDVARVLADPVLNEAGRWPGGYTGLVYLRLHGSPRMYYSTYDRSVLDALVVRLRLAAASGACVWCVFDNTASGSAVRNALHIMRALVEVA